MKTTDEWLAWFAESHFYVTVKPPQPYCDTPTPEPYTVYVQDETGLKTRGMDRSLARAIALAGLKWEKWLREQG